MKFIIKNLKNTSHTICREFGILVDIAPNDYFLIDTDSEREIGIWKNMSETKLKSYGLEVIFDEATVNQILSGKYDCNTRDASIVDGFVSPIAQEIMTSAKKEVEQINIEESNPADEYSEEKLLSMDKEDLFNICDNFNVKYKKNNSVKTLVKLLKEAGVVQ